MIATIFPKQAFCWPNCQWRRQESQDAKSDRVQWRAVTIRMTRYSGVWWSLVLRNDDVQEFDFKRDGTLLSMTKIPHDEILEGLHKLRIRESDVLELYDLEIHRNRTWYGKKKYRARFSEERNASGQENRNNSVHGKPTGSVWKETIALSATIWTSVEKLHHQIRLRILSCSRMRQMRWPAKSQRKVPLVECLDGPARITSKELAPIHSVKNDPPDYKTKSGCRFGEKCSFAHRQVDRQPTKRSEKKCWRKEIAMKENLSPMNVTIDRRPGKRSDKKLGQNSSKRQSSDALQLGCVFQDMTPPKSILRKGTDMAKPIQRVKFIKAVARHTKIRDQNPSLGYICPGEPHQRGPNAPKFEDRTPEETEWQEQGAREAAWKLGKSVLKLQEHQRAAFFSPSENRVPACINS